MKNWKLKSPTIAVFIALALMWALVAEHTTHGRDARATAEQAMAIPELSSSGVPEEATAELASLFKAASKDLRSTIITPPGKTASAQAFNQGRAAALSDRVDRVLLGLKRKVADWVPGKALSAVKAGRTAADAQAREAGVRVEGQALQGSFDVIDVRAASVFARDIATDLNKAADLMGGRVKRLLWQTAQEGLSEVDINKILAGGLIQGKPVAAIRELREALRKVHGDTVEVPTKSGGKMNFEVGYYAEMVARTRTREATVIARHERLGELGIDLVAIVGRVSNNFCTAFLGQVFSLGGKDSKYPAFDSLPGGGPPFHPNCTKSTRPFVPELASDSQIKAAEILDDSKTLLGMSPAKAQKAFGDLQLRSQVKERYATTEKKLFA